jgi:hypothetical protein
MNTQPHTARRSEPFSYIATDIPAGMTIPQYRRARAGREPHRFLKSRKTPPPFPRDETTDGGW